MSRINAADVEEIFDTDLSDTEIESFITTANLIVNNKLENQINDTDLLTEIERYLAAHFAALKDPRIKSRSFGDSKVTYQRNSGTQEMGLDATQYGQTAQQLDISDTLKNINKSKGTINMVSGI